MSYSASNVLVEAGIGSIMRWIASDVSERDVRNIIANKCIHPTRVPRNEVELEVDQACAREAMRLALKTHRELSVRVRTATTKDWTRASFWSDRKIKPDFTEEEYIEMDKVGLLFGSGGVLSHAPARWQAAMMMIDGLQPHGITEFGVDSVFMTPHLGMLSRLSVEAAFDTFVGECFVPLGSCIALSGRYSAGRRAAKVKLSGPRSEEFDIAWGEMKVIAAGSADEFSVEVTPARKVNAGAGPGRVFEGVCRGGRAGIIIDARGRPVQFPEEPAERRLAARQWRSSFEEAAK
jgi:hypothetical protein